MSGSSWPVPAACRSAYDTYLADLGTSAFAASTRVLQARCVRRFLRWVAEGGGDAQAVLAQQEAWDQAVARFVGNLATSAGRSTVRGHQWALADCARRLGLTEPPAPPRFGWVRDGYATALARSPYSQTTIRSNLTTVTSFLQWLTGTGYTGDLRRDWGTATGRYLQHLTAGGNATTSVRRRRAALTDCAARLGLPPAPTAAGHPDGGSTPPDPARGACSVSSALDRSGAAR